MAPNIWPDRPEGFRDTFLELFAAFDTAGDKLLSAIARYLGLAPDWFDPAVQGRQSACCACSTIRRSRPMPRASAPARMRTSTSSPCCSAPRKPGCELLDRDGRWLAIKPPEGAMVVNVGDMLQRLTNHVLPSTTHRVVNPPPERRGHSRYSMPFFLHPAPDFLIETLPQTITRGQPEPLSDADHRARLSARAAGRDRADEEVTLHSPSPGLVRGPPAAARRGAMLAHRCRTDTA